MCLLPHREPTQQCTAPGGSVGHRLCRWTSVWPAPSTQPARSTEIRSQVLTRTLGQNPTQKGQESCPDPAVSVHQTRHAVSVHSNVNSN